jgi:hypothetical protein
LAWHICQAPEKNGGFLQAQIVPGQARQRQGSCLCNMQCPAFRW